MTRTSLTRYSILDLAPVPEGLRPGDAIRNTIDLARHADGMNYTRYWLAEHHNMVGIASAATAVVIGQVAAATKRIRVGSGGIMLPNHAPLVIAEQFGTLAELFPTASISASAAPRARTSRPCGRCASTRWKPTTSPTT